MKKKIKSMLPFISILLVIIVFYIFNASFSSFIDNGERVVQGSDLTYYLDVYYDGKDSEATVSSDTALAKVYSDLILVEDKIPDGLTFKEFVGSSGGGEIGAVSRNDSSISCPGYVVGGTDGLVYNATNHTVSFKVKGLQAGCKLTVGVTTTVSNLGKSSRKDFYSVAYGRENAFSRYSNTAHTFMGINSLVLHSVTYKYADDSTVPTDAPTLPDVQSYEAGSVVNLIPEPSIPGYTFSGWSASGVSISSDSGSFVMPDDDVVLTGSFSKSEDRYTVTYSLSNDVKPDGYVLPDTREYTSGEYFKVDVLKSGDIIDGYKFLGWDLSSISGCISSDTSTLCLMPSSGVNIVGTFEKVQYSVSYQFKGDILPSDANNLLPATVKYTFGDKVTLADNPVAGGYRFLGWSSSNTFTMPEEDVVIYGEWAAQAGTFSPNMVITSSLDGENYSEPSSDSIYSKSDKKILFKTTISNTAAYDISDVMVKNNLDNNTIIENANYELLSNQYINIPTITAGGSVDIFSEFVIPNVSFDTYSVKMDLVGAIAANDYYLDDTTANSSTLTFNVSNIGLNVTVVNTDGDDLTDSNFALYKSSDFSDVPIEGKEFTKLNPNITYYLKQTRVSTGYVMTKPLTVNISSDGTITVGGTELKNDNFVSTVQVVNKKIDLLPQTGGLGIIPFVSFGLGIITVTAVIYILYLKKEGDERA